MGNLQASIEDVAGWCETHLDGPGSGRGTTLGAVLRIYGQLAAQPPQVNGEGYSAEWKALNAKAERLLKELSSQSIEPSGGDEQRRGVAEPASMLTNLMYDSRPH